MRRALAVPALVVAAALGLAACSSSGGTPPVGPTAQTSAPATARATASGTAATAAMIMIQDFGYQVSGSLSAGEKVTVHNSDDVAHTVTADSGNAFDVNVPASGDATFTAPSKPGTYTFHCTYHSNMHGKLVVK